MKSSNEVQNPSKLKAWLIATRPHTLPLSMAPVLVGATLTWIHVANSRRIAVDGSEEEDEEMKKRMLQKLVILPLGLSFGAFAFLIQIGTNLHNDYADFVKGADNDERVGHARSTQKGWLTPTETATGSTVCLMIASAIGICFCRRADDDGIQQAKNIPSIFNSNVEVTNFLNGNRWDWTMIFIIITSIFNAVAYTGGPYPLGYIGLGHISIGYSGLGDLFVFLYFGLVATMSVPYIFVRLTENNSDNGPSSLFQLMSKNELLQTSFFVAVPIASLATAVIVVNNLRDRETDIRVGKRTLAVRFGETFARLEYALLIFVSIGATIAMAVIRKSWTWSLPLLAMFFVVKSFRAVAMREADGQALNEHVGATARVQLCHCILLSLGMILSS